nr:hypothetical protein [Xanthomonas translucens]
MDDTPAYADDRPPRRPRRRCRARILQRIPGPLRIGAPLGIGKPHRLFNALYDRVAADPARLMQLYTALSLNRRRPAAGWKAASCARSCSAISATTSRS